MGALYSSAASALARAAGAEAPPSAESTDLLFVGDSLSYYNGGVWEEVARLAPEGAVGRIETVMKGGAPLARLLPMARAALTELGPKEETGRRRVCVLQEDLPETTLESFESSARSLAQFCKAFGWEVVLLSCWGYDGGGRPGVTAFSDAAVLKAHRRVARELGAVVAPAGAAKARCELLLREGGLPAMPLLSPRDNEHPTVALTHMTARCLVGAIFGRDAASAAPPAGAEARASAEQAQVFSKAVDLALVAEELRQPSSPDP